MPDLTDQLAGAAGAVPDVDVVPAIRGRVQRRRRARLSMIGAVVVVALGGAVALAGGGDEPQRVQVVDDPPAPGIFATPTGVVLLFDDGYDGATALDLDTGLVGRRAIEGQSAGDEGSPFRAGDALVVGWGPPSLAPLDGSPSIPLEGTYTYVPSGTGDVWARTEAGLELRHYDATGALLGSWPAPEGFPQLGLADGLAVQRGSFLDLWDAATGTVVATIDDGFALAADDEQLAWCPNGRCDVVHLRALGGSASPDVDAPIGQAVVAAVFSPDGSTLAVRTTDSVALVDTSTGSVEPLATYGFGDGPLAWSPDGSQLFFASNSYMEDSLQVWRLVVATATLEEVGLPFGGTLGMLALDRSEAASFLPTDDEVGEPGDCPPPDVEPSGRTPGVVCGFRIGGTPSVAAPATTGPAEPEQLYRWSGAVVDAGDGPVLCAGRRLESWDGRPVACDAGIPLVGWTLGSGEYTVVGTWDGTAFHVAGTSDPDPAPTDIGLGVQPPPVDDHPRATADQLAAARAFLASPEAGDVLGPVLTTSIDDADRGYIVVVVAVATPGMQAAVDERVGAGVVEVTSALEPVG